MGIDKETETAHDASQEPLDPNDPMNWDEVTLRKYVGDWLFMQQGHYSRTDPSDRENFLTDEQKPKVADRVVKYWMPKDIDAVALLAGEDDNAQETPRKPEDTFATIIRNRYEREKDLNERKALNTAKSLVADRLSNRDLNALPTIAATHARIIIRELAAWEKPKPRPRSPYGDLL